MTRESAPEMANAKARRTGAGQVGSKAKAREHRPKTNRKKEA